MFPAPQGLFDRPRLLRGSHHVPHDGEDARRKSSRTGGTGGGQEGRSTHHDKSRSKKPPDSSIFTKDTLLELLLKPPNEVILALHSQLPQWNEFLSSESLASDRDSVNLIAAIVGTKLTSSEVTLDQQRFQILMSTTSSSSFRTRVMEICTRILMGLDESTLSISLPFLSNVFNYSTVLVNNMPQTSVDFLQGVISSAVTATLSLSPPPEEEAAKQYEQLKSDFTRLKDSLGVLMKSKEKEARLFRPKRDNFFSEEDEAELHAMKPPNDYRDIPVIPSVEELLSKEPPFLRPNIIKGSYSSPSHYLDTQFRLLREDFVQPLRHGVQDFLKHRNEYLRREKRLPNGSVRIYPDVQITGAELVRETYIYQAQLPQSSAYQRINWEKSKRLMSGSLIVFTADFFASAYFGIIGARKTEELRRGLLNFTWVGSSSCPSWNTSRFYLMLECEVFFEPYRHTLETLKILALGQFPMAKFIVGGSSEVRFPNYLEKSDKIITLTLKDKTTTSFYADILNDWPSADALGLDSNQSRAFQAALTSEFVIIQGPPGTGKTYLGLRIAEALLQNVALWKESPPSRDPASDESDDDDYLHHQQEDNGPILVVCYTNHALDQFLEGILAIMKAKKPYWASDLSHQSPLIRIGGRSKSEELAEHSLRAATMKMKSKRWENDDEVDSYKESEYYARREVSCLKKDKEKLVKQLPALLYSYGVVDFSVLQVAIKLRNEVPYRILQQLQSTKWLQLDDSTSLEKIIDEWIAEAESGSISPHNNVGGIDMSEMEEFRKIFGTSGDEFDLQNNIVHPEIVEDAVAAGAEEFEEDYDVQEILDQRMIEDLYIDNNEPYTSSYTTTTTLWNSIRFLDKWEYNCCEEKYLEELSERDLYLKKCREDPNRSPSQDFIDMKMKQFNKRIKEILERKVLLEKLFKARKNPQIFPTMENYIQNMKQKISEPRAARAEKEEESMEERQARIKEAEKNVQESLDSLDVKSRWALYFTVLQIAVSLCRKEFPILDKGIIDAEKKLHRIRRYGEGLALRSAEVVGMTTTGAAKYHDLVTMMRAKIVIVEEAAEVLESHIVTCLSRHCEHLILIGDHLQLRPSTTVYQLAKQYKLEVSLFERMLNNELNCYRLKVQHRMRPEIADLVVGTVYDELENHEKVTKYPEVLGMAKSLFFLDHTHPEKSDSDSLSKSNEFEARYVVSLCKHLLAQGYTPEQITILTTYTGQMFLIKKFANLFLDFKVKVTCVDNYQGEENEIIILSLVRSNKEGNIGFLKVDNRVCVSLSRAKIGFYILGNMSILSDKSEIWPQINEKLRKRDEIGECLSIKCQIHGNIQTIRDEKDFGALSPRGGCRKECNTELDCGHVCNSVCHVMDREHKEFYLCRAQCSRECPKGHVCVGKCVQKCPPCKVRVPNVLNCLHEAQIPCYLDPKDFRCQELVDKLLPCGHEETLTCSSDPSEYTCRRKSVKELPCHHRKEVECHEDLSAVRCKIYVKKSLPCGHSQEVECWRNPKHVACQAFVLKKFQYCNHEMEVKCFETDKPSLQCTKDCLAALDCGHLCRQKCHIDKDPHHLLYMCQDICQKKCSAENQHACTSGHKCYLSCPPCSIPVQRLLEKCYHRVQIKCSSDYRTVKCKERCSKVLNCGHICPQRCSQPCGDCKEQIMKKIEDCGHEIKFPCSQTPTRRDCEEKVNPSAVQADCGHKNIQVPCKISDAMTGAELTLKYCDEPCTKDLLACPHKCRGTCRSCHQGNFHVKCTSACGKNLICGHKCNSVCSITCTPCMQKCVVSCEHKRCNYKCSSICKPCKQKCPWQCEHKQCTKLCNEICDRDPCEQPCPKLLLCGHHCLGFCGEPCPTLCGICDMKYLGIPDNSRYVLLQDCNHNIEATTLEAHVTSNTNTIGMLKCPACETIITRCRRLNKIIKARIAEVSSAKPQVTKSITEVKEAQSILINKIKAIDESTKGKKDGNEILPLLFPVLYSKLCQLVVSKLSKKNKRGAHIGFKCTPKHIEPLEFETIDFLFRLACDTVDLLRESKRKLSDGLYKDLKEKFSDLLDKQFVHLEHPLKASEIQDVNAQVERLHYLRYLYVFKSSSEFFENRNQIRPLYYKILDCLHGIQFDRGTVQNLIQTLKDKAEFALDYKFIPYQIEKVVYGYEVEQWTRMDGNIVPQ